MMMTSVPSLSTSSGASAPPPQQQQQQQEEPNPLQQGRDRNGPEDIDASTAGNETKYGGVASAAFNLALQPIDTSTLFLQHFDGRFVDPLQEEDFHLYYVRGQTVKPATVLLIAVMVVNVVLYVFSPDFLRVPGCFASDILKLVALAIGIPLVFFVMISRCCWWRMESDLACDRMVYAMKFVSLMFVVIDIQRTLYDDRVRVPLWQDGFDRFTGVSTPLFTFYNQPRLIPTAVLVVCCWIGGLLIRIPRAPGWDNAFNFVALAIYLWMVYRMEAAAREQFKVHRQSYAQRELTATVREYVNKLLARRLTNAMLTALATGEPVAHHTEVGTAVAMKLRPPTSAVPTGANIIAVQKLHFLFGGIVDDLAKKYGGTRVASQTGHSQFLVVFGLPVERHHTSERACAFASDLREAYEAIVVPKTQTWHRLCIGVHSGALHGGVNPDQRMEYQAFGSVVDIATYMSMQPFSASTVADSNDNTSTTTSNHHTSKSQLRRSQCFVSMATLDTVNGCQLGYDPMPPMRIDTSRPSTFLPGAPGATLSISVSASTTEGSMGNPSSDASLMGAGGGGGVATVVAEPALIMLPIALLNYVRSRTVGRTILDLLQDDLPEAERMSHSNRSTLRKTTFRSRKRRLLRETFESTVRSQQLEGHAATNDQLQQDTVVAPAAEVRPTTTTTELPETFKKVAPEEDLEIIRKRFSNTLGCLWHRFEDQKVEQGYRHFAATNYITGSRRWLWLCVASWCLLVFVAMLISRIYFASSLVPVAVALLLSSVTFALIPKCAPKYARIGSMLDFLSLTVTAFLCWGGIDVAVGFPIAYDTGGRTIVNLIQFSIIFGMKGSTGQIPWGLQAALSCLLMLPEYYVMVFVYQGGDFVFVIILTLGVAVLLALLARSSDRQLREVYIDSLMTTYALTEAKEEQINIFALFRRTMPAALVEPAMDWMAKGRQLGGLVFQVPQATVIFGEFTLRGAEHRVTDFPSAHRYIQGLCKVYHQFRCTLASFPESLVLVWASGNAVTVMTLPNATTAVTTSSCSPSQQTDQQQQQQLQLQLQQDPNSTNHSILMINEDTVNELVTLPDMMHHHHNPSSFSSTPMPSALLLASLLVDPVYFSNVEAFDAGGGGGGATHGSHPVGAEAGDARRANESLPQRDIIREAANGNNNNSGAVVLGGDGNMSANADICSEDVSATTSPMTTSRTAKIFQKQSSEVERFVFSLLQLVPQGSPSADSSTADAAAAAQWIATNCEWRVGVAQGSIVGGILSDGIDCDILSTALDAAKRMASDRRSGTDDSTTVYEYRDGYSLVPEGYSQGCVGRITVSTSLLALSSSMERSREAPVV